MTIVATIGLIWVLAFAFLLVPTRWIAARMAKSAAGWPGVALSICLCFVIAKFVVAVVCVVLVFGQFEVFPHFNRDPLHFGFFFVGVLLFVPAFAALLTGYLRARRTAYN